MRKRILRFALVLALALALLPAGVLAAGPSAVQIGGVALQEGRYLPSNGSALTDTAPDGGYAHLSGGVLTLRDFILETTVVGADAAMEVTGDVTLRLEGSSSICSYNEKALLVRGDLTVNGEGSLRIHGRFHAIHADRFVMEAGAVAASSEPNGGGNGITAGTAVFRGGSLTVDADYPFFRTDEECDTDPIVTAEPAAGSTVTVWYGFRDAEALRKDYTASGDLAIRDSDGMIYHRFWISDQPMEACPDTLEFPFDLRVGGVYVTQNNCHDVLGDGTVRFDPQTNTLLLTDAHLTADGPALFATGMDLTVELAGSSTLTSNEEAALQLDFGSLTLRGGALTVSGATAGIFTYGGDLTVENTDLTATASEGHGINTLSGNARFEGGSVDARGSSRAINVPNGAMDVIACNMHTVGEGSYGINVSTTLTVEQSRLENYGRPYQGLQESGSYDNGDDGLEARDFVILDSTVETTGGEDGAWLSGSLTVKRSKVTFSGSQNAVQINGGPVVIEDSTVTARLQDIGDDPSYGMDIAIYAKQDITVTRSNVTAASRPGAPAIAVLKGSASITADYDRPIEQVGVKGSSGSTTQVMTFVDETGKPIELVEIRFLIHCYDKLDSQTAPADAPALPFTDVAETDWFRGDVADAWRSGLIDGVTDTAFCPEAELTVAQTVKLAAALHQRHHEGEVTLENGEDCWYSTYVDYAAAAGIVPPSYQDLTAQQMNAPVSRREFVAIFFGAMPESSYIRRNQVSDNAIPDVKKGDDRADEIYTFYRAGILTGSDAMGTFRPDSTIRRAEAAAILIRMYDVSARQRVELG